MNVAAGNTLNLSLIQRGVATKGGSSFSLVAAANQQTLLHSYSVFNGTGSAMDLGLGINYTPTVSNFQFLQVGASNTDVTAQALAGSSLTLFDTTTNHGFIVENTKHFGLVILNVTQAVSGSPVFTFQYWNGSSWVTLNLNQTPAFGVGLNYIGFNPPSDWVKGDGVTTTKYAIRVLASTASGQSVLGTFVSVARWIAYRNQVPSYNQLQVIYDWKPYLLESGETLQPFFGTANAANSIEAAYQVAP